LHCPQANESSSPAKASFTMNGNCAGITLGSVFSSSPVLVRHFKELIYNVIWWRRSIDEKQIVVVYIVVQEVFSVIFLLV
jgi:hypothetical protein